MSNAKVAVASPAPAQTQPQATGAKPTATNAKADDGKKDNVQNAAFLIMYNGDITLAVDDVKLAPAIDKIVDAAEAAGGHMAGRRDQSVQIRVPSARFREALAKISELGDVIHESITAEDVSEEYHDAEVRIQNLKATRQRLQDFLSKAATMPDMLTLERELERVSMDIDRIEGRMRFLREHVAFSTLTVNLAARPKAQSLVTGGTTSAPNPKRLMQLHAAWLDDMGVPKLNTPGS